MAENPNPNPIYEEKWEELIFTQNGKSTKTIMRALKPCTNQITNNINPIDKTLLLSHILSQKHPIESPIKVSFPGWKKPSNQWSNWVEKLCPKYAKVWLSTGICDGILCSLHEIRHNPGMVMSLTEYWCPKTNTFVFPWGEVTITLEDLMILAGLPVLGEPINYRLSDDSMRGLEGELDSVRRKLSSDKIIRRATYSAWIKYFNEKSDGIESLEHLGFLAYWLSRFVFPGVDERVVGKHVFPIAVLLSQGVKVALGPALLACLYRNLTHIARSAADCGSDKRDISVAGPFQIVHLWALERFPLLGSKLAKPLGLRQLRIARWDKVNFKESLVRIRSVLRSVGSFEWRPYALDLENWRHPSFYPETDLTVSDCSALDDDELKSFGEFLRPQELIGLDCAEMYRPQRVARQFGYDQDLPGENKFSVGSGSENIKVFVASRSLNPGVSRRYNDWWRSVSEGLQQEGSDHEKPMLKTDDVKSELKFDGCDPVSIAAAKSSPSKEAIDESSYSSGKKRKFCSTNEDWRSERIEIVDLVGDDDEDDEPRAGDSADNPLNISYQCSRVGMKDRGSGNSLKNPIDVENWYF